MPDVLWFWQKGNINVFTRNLDVVDKAIHEGALVEPIYQQSHVFLPVGK